MNPYKHAEISVQKRGGKIEDYYPIHFFLDSTKELCSDNRHRILHNLWGIRRVIIPIFGSTITNSAGKIVNVKDLCEQDHILPDYRNKFIPTLKDFVDAISIEENELLRLEKVISDYEEEPAVCQMLLSPLSVTGSLKSLLITHNTWFIHEILPLILDRKPMLGSHFISPSLIFSNMSFELWMDNGQVYPKSALSLGNILDQQSILKA